MSEDDEVALSERRGRTKWSLDPRNTFWSSDKSRFGFRMLEQMGWEEGKGLGANEDGTKDHVKISKKSDNSGVGASKSHSDDWVEHQESFESLLAELNGSNNDLKSRSVVKDLTSVAKKSKKLTYQKFLKSKDIFHKSSEDLNCVLVGKRNKKRKSARASEDEDDISSKKEPHIDDISGITTIKSEVDSTNYFSQKKQKLKKSRTDKVKIDGVNKRRTKLKQN